MNRVWVKSQNDVVMSCLGIYSEYKGYECYQILGVIDGNIEKDIVLGVYRTPEDAATVTREIEAHIERESGFSLVSLFRGHIYTLPQKDDKRFVSENK